MSVQEEQPTPQQWVSAACECIAGFIKATGVESLTIKTTPNEDGTFHAQLEAGSHDEDVLAQLETVMRPEVA